MPDGALYDAVAARLRDGLTALTGRAPYNESETRSLLIEPVLDAIGYERSFRRPESGGGAGSRNIPDELCYTDRVVGDMGPAAIIVEAKTYGVDFDRAHGGLSAASPDRQIQRYLRQHPASGPNTVGVLTDGIRWRVYERTSDPASFDVRFLTEYDFQGIAGEEHTPSMLPADAADRLQNFVDRLCRECVLKEQGAPPKPRKPGLADRLFGVFRQDDAAAVAPGAILPHLLGGRMIEAHRDIAEHVPLGGIEKDAHDKDWSDYSYALGAPLQTDAPTLEGKRIVTAVVRYADGPQGLSRADTALCARTFSRVEGAGTCALLAYRVGPDGTAEARLAVCAGGRVAMTAPFDPALPPPSASAAIEKALAVLGEQDALAPDRLLAPLEVAPLRQRFYADVSAWTRRLAAGKSLVQREAVLRHLIRVMFAWILKEDGLIPDALFERAFAASTMRDVDRYHENVLRFLFEKRLNTAPDKRDPHDDPAIHFLMDDAPFVNGSLFMEQEGDDDLNVLAEDYWGSSDERPGLFTIFSRYHWTTDEHRPGESEQTLDPELLSNLFERLILVIEEDEDEPPDKMPRGTYYTPADVTTEMVKDALAAVTRPHAPAHVTDWDLLGLFGDPDAPLPEMSVKERAALAERIHALRIFDPAVGSGAFLFGCLVALQTALGKLERSRADFTRRIIREQLHGQDIHPLAAQITRLRLFIALKATDRKANRKAPLPNLDARIVCADTLETSADPGWRPDHPGQLDTADPELVNALVAVAENRGAWLDAHTEEEKQAVLNTDGGLRNDLSRLLRGKGALASIELMEFAENTPLFARHARPARTDARLLFYENPWRGFDIVIGNPPYEASSKSMDAERKRLLAANKRYRTTNCGDLYTLFCETALALANPDGGVVTMIVPLSIAFGQQQRTLRRAFEDRCTSINLRHYDNIPDTAFNGAPTLKAWKNRQRSTIITAVCGQAASAPISSTGLQRWTAPERELVLHQRRTTTSPRLGETKGIGAAMLDRRIAEQWLRIPTPEVAAMVTAILSQKRNVGSYLAAEGAELAFPLTAGYFIATIPPKTANPRHEERITVAEEDLPLIMATVNGHAGLGWWRICGDGFHVNAHEVTTLAIPDAWAANPQPAIDLGRRLIEIMPSCITAKRNAGTIWRNVDFYRAPDLIAEIDRLYIEALGLPVEPLLTHLKIMRSNRSWDFSAASG